MEKIKKEEQERVDILLTDQRQPSNHVIKMRHDTLLDTTLKLSSTTHCSRACKQSLGLVSIQSWLCIALLLHPLQNLLFHPALLSHTLCKAMAQGLSDPGFA
jgi:hypothetical protein